MHPFITLFIAIICEVAATLSLKFSDGFTRITPSSVAVLGYATSAYFLAITLKHGMPIGIAYAIWAGMGTASVVLFGALFWKETLSLYQIIAILVIVLGVIALNLVSESAHG